ncbi:uncharacterized protein LOC129606484 [Condylostylus longicornis]|uniref:uncharacterized protein LOC129606484 n=1 Tax=Condylostylus longicornis TaxID=2530218 RepID=UPI00244DF3B4|nr:uncharacterized protein LOC129606484 [Condylostylus longicornis]
MCFVDMIVRYAAVTVFRESFEKEFDNNVLPIPNTVNVLRNEELLWNYEIHNDYYGKFFQFENTTFNGIYAKEFLKDLQKISKESEEYSVQILFRLGFESVLKPFHGNLILFKLIYGDENGLNDIRLCFNIRIYSHSNSMNFYHSKTQEIQNCANIVMQRHSIADGKWHSLVATITRKHTKILFDCTQHFEVSVKNGNFGFLESMTNDEFAKIIIGEKNTEEYIQLDVRELEITTEIGQKNSSICNRAKNLNSQTLSNKIELHKKIHFKYEQRDWDLSKFHRMTKQIYTNIVLPQNSTYSSSNFTFECIFRCYRNFEGQLALLSMFDSKDGNNMNFGIISGKSLVWNNLSRTQSTFEVSRGVFKENVLNGEWNHVLIKIITSETTKTLQFYSNCELLKEDTLEGSFFFRDTLQQIILFRNISLDRFQKFDVKEMNLYWDQEVDECKYQP